MKLLCECLIALTAMIEISPHIWRKSRSRFDILYVCVNRSTIHHYDTDKQIAMQHTAVGLVKPNSERPTQLNSTQLVGEFFFSSEHFQLTRGRKTSACGW